MARRDRRRGGAHSAPRRGRRSTDLPPEPTPASGPGPDTPRAPPPPASPLPPSSDPVGDATATVEATGPPTFGVPAPRGGAALGDQTGESFFGSALPPAAAGATASDLLDPDPGTPLSRKDRK